MEHQRAVQNLSVESYLLGDMSPLERDEFENHYFRMQFVQGKMSALRSNSWRMREILGEDARAGDRPQAWFDRFSGSSRTAKETRGGRTPGWLRLAKTSIRGACSGRACSCW
mgnify:CR=1 FL=1